MDITEGTTQRRKHWIEKIEDVERQLGFRLFVWQKQVEYGIFRQYAATTAKISRLLINTGADS